MIRSLLISLLLAAPVAAQTVEEAARINAEIALQLCIQPHVQPAMRAQMFRNAGFTERVERSHMNSDTTHTFTAPANTVEVELYYGEMPEHCQVSSNYLGVTAASPVVDSVVPQFYPGFVRRAQQGPIDPATGQPAQCIVYEDPTNPIGLAIGVSPGQGAQGCVENGTSVFYLTARV
ncbi:MAG: hypothetical protein ABJH07_09160 [Sedimentitalea sp.]|uniref:hypothetical protein n=1 Tax=Sedimentitalea sp. TaxID=2048915 RepID=UPI00326755AD